ncbi:MAG: hypothetical protein KDK91_04275 [Gammaproteobacteria bacterium]|nr:hypothetical protein [Gammaproteobacteria bacterium]
MITPVVARALRTLLLLLGLGLALAGTAQAGCSAGDEVDVLWKGKWYGAQVLKVRSDQCYIHYHGYDNSWDEWVGPDRYSLRVGDGSPVWVAWKGKWYAAHVLRRSQNQYYVHYDGYDSSWDEWVGNPRIRNR